MRLGDPPSERREEAIDGLLTLASDKRGEVRAIAYETLGELGETRALESLLDGFDDPDPAARQAAVLAAGRVDPVQSLDAIAALLYEERPEMRFSGLWTLHETGLATPSHVVTGLRDPDPEVRQLAAQCVRDAQIVECRDHTAELLSDPSPDVRFAAACALAALGDSSGASLLREALGSADRAFDAAIALGDLRERGAVGDLTKLAHHRFRSPIIRAAAARALVLLGDPAGTAVIRRLVRSWRIEARQYAVELVGELGLVSLVPDLEGAMRRSAGRERPVYVSTLEQIADQSPEARRLLASLRQAEQSSS